MPQKAAAQVLSQILAQFGVDMDVDELLEQEMDTTEPDEGADDDTENAGDTGNAQGQGAEAIRAGIRKAYRRG